MRPVSSQPSLTPYILALGAIGISLLACSTGPKTTGTPAPPKVGLVAQGESFSNLTAITENMEECDEASTSVDGKVVFACFRDNNWDLYMKASPTGGAVQKLTSHGAHDVNPTISPKGDRVAFTSNRSGNYDIFIMSLNGGTAKQQVTDNQALEFTPSWSPDGTMLAYTRLDPIDNEYYIWIKNLETNANIQLGPGLAPKFSPDGDKILFQKQSQQGSKWFGLWTMDLNGSQLTQIVASDEWGAIDANWSPDGRKFIFVSSKGTSGKFYNEVGKQRIPTQASNNLWVVNSDGSAMTQLTTHPKSDIMPSWSAQNHIYFTSWRDGKKRIWRFTPILPDNYVPNTVQPMSEPQNDIMEEPAEPTEEVIDENM